MQIASHTMSDMDKVAVIQFDEMKVHSVYEYDQLEDEVVGPHTQMQVVMVRGLFSKWKQPIFIDFDQKMTKKILLDIISQLEEISYHVVVCVSDCGGGNVGLWSNWVFL